MKLEKEQLALVRAMIETTYRPIIQRAIVNLVLLNVSQALTTVKAKSVIDRNQQSLNLLHSSDCKRALLVSLMNVHIKKGPDMIDEIIKQYNLSLNADEISLYHYEMEAIFRNEIENVANMIENSAYSMMHEISRSAGQQ